MPCSDRRPRDEQRDITEREQPESDDCGAKGDDARHIDRVRHDLVIIERGSIRRVAGGDRIGERRQAADNFKFRLHPVVFVLRQPARHRPQSDKIDRGAMQQPGRIFGRIGGRETGGELAAPVLVGIAPFGPARFECRTDDMPAQVLVILSRGERLEQRIEPRQLRARRLHRVEDFVQRRELRAVRYRPRQQRHFAENVHAAPAAEHKAAVIGQLTGRGGAIHRCDGQQGHRGGEQIAAPPQGLRKGGDKQSRQQ